MRHEIAATSASPILPPGKLQGVLKAFILYDVAEEIDLDSARRHLGIEEVPKTPSFKHPAPDYVAFERAPVIEAVEPLVLSTGERTQGRIKYYDYGVASVELELGFSGSWQELKHAANRWMSTTEIAGWAERQAHSHLKNLTKSLRKPYDSWISEEYYMIHLHHPEQDDRALTVKELLGQYGSEIAQMVRGELSPLAEDEQAETLRGAASYYPHDLVVVGWTAAFLYDTPLGAAPAIQLLEYANAQLLEYRHYDAVLTKVLEGVYRTLDRGTGVVARWRLAREAAQLNTILLDVRELTERTDNAIKFLSDMFYARLYRLAAAKVGVPDYRNLVEGKLRTAGDLYTFMVDQFHQGRAFLMEFMIVFILIIDLIFLFKDAWQR